MALDQSRLQKTVERLQEMFGLSDWIINVIITDSAGMEEIGTDPNDAGANVYDTAYFLSDIYINEEVNKDSQMVFSTILHEMFHLYVREMIDSYNIALGMLKENERKSLQAELVRQEERLVTRLTNLLSSATYESFEDIFEPKVMFSVETNILS